MPAWAGLLQRLYTCRRVDVLTLTCLAWEWRIKSVKARGKQRTRHHENHHHHHHHLYHHAPPPPTSATTITPPHPITTTSSTSFYCLYLHCQDMFTNLWAPSQLVFRQAKNSIGSLVWRMKSLGVKMLPNRHSLSYICYFPYLRSVISFLVLFCSDVRASWNGAHGLADIFICQDMSELFNTSPPCRSSVLVFATTPRTLVISGNVPHESSFIPTTANTKTNQ